jgi:hypothetical protein
VARETARSGSSSLALPAPPCTPGVGRIKPWSAALRAGPSGPGQGKANTVADLPRGTEVRVTGKQAGWLAVTAGVGGKTLGGYVSHELIEFLHKDVFEGDLGEVRVHVPSAADALVKLKGLEKRQERGGGKLKLDEDEQSDAELAMGVLEQSKKYDVDHRTFAVTFHRSASQKTTVRTIEDFVLFVEEVERAYPRATLAEVASELRQLWFSDSNWDILSAGEGISEGSKLVDIESEGPVAASFDMKQIAPKGGGLQLNTRYGRVDITRCRRHGPGSERHADQLSEGVPEEAGNRNVDDRHGIRLHEEAERRAHS